MRWLARWSFPKLALCTAAAIACSSSKKNDVDAPSLPVTGNGGTNAAPPTAGTTGAMGGASSAGIGSGVAGSAGGSGSSGATGDAAVGDAAAFDAAVEDPALADCFAHMDEAASDGTKTPYPGGRWTVPAATYGAMIETDIEIEMSDGVVLVGDVSYPTDLATGARASGEFPVILTLNPYGAAFGASYGEIFVTHGYIFVSVDVRGTTRSGGGVHDLFSPREAMDGAEVVSWVAKLEGSDGRVGLQGCSQLGINQLETASQLAPDSPVKAMIPACPSGDFYRDTAFDNGIPSLTASFLVPDSAMGDDTAYYREYWRARDRVARAPAIAHADIPLLLWSGWHEPGALGSFELYTVLQNVAAGRSANAPVAEGQSVSGKYQVIIGDWAHGGGLDLGIELQFYDTWIKGIDTGMSKDTNTPLHLAELGGTRRWINARCYPLVKRYTPFFLSAGGALTSAADSDADQDELRWVPQAAPADTVEYASEPFADGAMLAGPLTAQLQVTSSNTNLQMFVEVFDRPPSGALAKIGFGSIIGALRRSDPEKSWTDESGLPTRPFLALDEHQPMTAGERTQLDVPLGPTVWSIEPGHSIVVRISTHPADDDCLGVLTPPVGCYPTKPMLDTLPGGVYDLHLGGELGSLISLPLLDHGTFAAIKTASSPTGAAEYPLPIDW
ncbi:MAG TPA: CocE/NonD family hydrolase [Polyangiaceae bacterium]|nr:CocE/NonD family hydrolase [Polyangiaceae bacterium]